MEIAIKSGNQNWGSQPLTRRIPLEKHNAHTYFKEFYIAKLATFILRMESKYVSVLSALKDANLPTLEILAGSEIVTLKFAFFNRRMTNILVILFVLLICSRAASIKEFALRPTIILIILCLVFIFAAIKEAMSINNISINFSNRTFTISNRNPLQHLIFSDKRYRFEDMTETIIRSNGAISSYDQKYYIDAVFKGRKHTLAGFHKEVDAIKFVSILRDI